jgi:hypothetical protein
MSVGEVTVLLKSRHRRLYLNQEKIHTRTTTYLRRRIVNEAVKCSAGLWEASATNVFWRNPGLGIGTASSNQALGMWGAMELLGSMGAMELNANTIARASMYADIL